MVMEAGYDSVVRECSSSRQVEKGVGIHLTHQPDPPCEIYMLTFTFFYWGGIGEVVTFLAPNGAGLLYYVNFFSICISMVTYLYLLQL